MSMAKRKYGVSMGASTHTTSCCTSASSDGSTRLGASLHHWTSKAELADISALMSAVSCSDDMRLLSPELSTPSVARVLSGVYMGPTGLQAKGDSHCTSMCCTTGLQVAPAVVATQGYVACANSASCIYTADHNVNSYSRSNSADSTCSTYKIAEPPDFECRSSNAEAICSPLLSTSNIWRFESSSSARTTTSPALAARSVTTPVEHFDWRETANGSTRRSPRVGFTQPTPITTQPGHGVVCRGGESLASGVERDMDSSQLLDILESVARRRRSSLFSGNRTPQLAKQPITWRGVLQPKEDATGRTLSRKVFVGGLSRDMDSRCLLEAFQAFGVERIEWYPRAEKGFAYAIFRRESRLRTLLNVCSRDAQGRYYFKVGTLRPYRERQVQLIPWLVDDSDLTQFAAEGGRPEINDRTVFVGALHGEMTARDLAIVMQKCFGTVLTVGLDTDKFKYPCGTARVTFQHPHSQASALAAGYIRVESNKFTKTLQIDPFLQDVLCTTCYRGPGPVFCRHFSCFTYFCPACFFDCHHVRLDAAGKPVIPEGHEPLTKNRVIKRRHSSEH